jgi:hypothetical protein
MSRALSFAGDVELEKVILYNTSGKKANILGQVLSIEVYEDLFTPFRTLNVVLKDSVDYISKFPFIGEEYLDVKIYTPTLENKAIQGKFYIYRIADRQPIRNREVVYTLKAISEEWVTDINTKLSQTFKGKCSELAQKIVENSLKTKKKINVESSINVTAFTAGYWPPIKCLNFLATNAISQKKSPTYLFYENREGFNFNAIETLLEQKTYQKFIRDNYTREMDNDTFSQKNPEEDFKRILDLIVPDVGDYFNEIQNGRLKSHIITHDAATNSYKTGNYNADDQTLLNPEKGYKKPVAEPKGSTIVMNKHFMTYDNIPDATNADTVQKRESFFQNLMKFKMTMLVIGRTDYRVGQVMELSIPKSTEITSGNSNTDDPIVSGRYLLSAVAHYINKDYHRCSMELIKNSILKG